MDIGGSSRHLPTTSRVPQSQWNAIYSVKSKINNFLASGASKTDHYWVISDPMGGAADTQNCTISYGNCGIENSPTITL
jgi:hypothetical protein